MRIHRHKSSVEKQEISGSVTTSVSIKSNTSLREWNSTTLDTIGQAVSIMFPYVWLLGMLIELDSRKEKEDNA